MGNRARWMAVLAFGVAAAALVAAPARSDNPKVSLKLESVTADEATKQLSKAAGVPLELYGTGNPVAPGAPGERATFDWTDVSFARALRQLCQKFLLTPGKRPNGYVLYNAPGAPPAPAKRVGEVVKNGVRVYARGVSVSEWRRVDFAGQNGANGYANLSVELGCELGDGDGEAIAGLENVTARDDQGNVTQQDARNFSGSYGGGVYPDEWYGSLTLPMTSSKARKLVYVEGDLMVYRKVKHQKMELPLPLTDKKARRQLGDVTIVVSHYKEKDQDAEDDGPDLPRPFQGQTGGPTLQMRVYTPAGSRMVGRASVGAWGFQPYLVGASGKTYPAMQTSSRGWGDGQTSVSESTLNFPAMNEAPAKLVWEATEREDPVKLLTFRMNDLPLPDPATIVPRRNRVPGQPGVPDVVPDHPFFEKGGGTLSTRVEIGGKPAGEGTLQIGLAPRVGTGWGPIRWMEAVVGEDGVARIENLKPGAYRLMRTYRAKAGTAPAGKARWLNTQVEVVLQAGKEASPVPLRWAVGVEKGVSPVPGGAAKLPLKKASAR